MRSPTGARPRAVRWFGEAANSARVVSGDHVVDVPLDHARPDGERIEVYARERHHDALRRSGPDVLDRLEQALAEAAPGAVPPARPAGPEDAA